MFFVDENVMPTLIDNARGVKGLHTNYGLTTYRLNNPRFTPSVGNILKLDVICDATSKIKLIYFDANSKEEYRQEIYIVGGVWQSIIAECKNFKNSNGTALAEFSSNSRFSITGDAPFAVNNIMWL